MPFTPRTPLEDSPPRPVTDPGAQAALRNLRIVVEQVARDLRHAATRLDAAEKQLHVALGHQTDASQEPDGQYSSEVEKATHTFVDISGWYAKGVRAMAADRARTWDAAGHPVSEPEITAHAGAITERIALAVETARKRGWGDTCSTCRFFSHSDSHADSPEEPESHFGRCMRFPPTPGVRREENSYGWTVDGIYGRPEVDGTDWCGEWRPGETRNPKATDLAPTR